MSTKTNPKKKKSNCKLKDDNLICRLCLRKDASVDIFRKRPNVYLKLSTFCKLKMHKNDGLPKMACKRCVSELNKVLKFIKRCEQSQEKLKNGLDPHCVSDSDGEGSFIKTDHFGDDSNADDNYETDNYDTLLPDIVKQEPLEATADYCNNLVYNNDDCDNILYNPEIKIKEEVLDIVFVSVEEEPQKRTKINSRKKSVDKQQKLKKENQIGQLCSVCGMVITTTYTKHKLLHKIKEIKYTCDFCKLIFNCKSELESHMPMHMGEKPFPCLYCHKSFKANRYLKMHTKSIHLKSVSCTCSVCGKSFSSPRSLKMHCLIHIGEKRHECPVCHKMFLLSQVLKGHMRTHTGEKPYSCKYCDSSFALLGSAKEHERLHTGERPFKCPICSKGFAQRGNMKSHMRHNHKEIAAEKSLISTL